MGRGHGQVVTNLDELKAWVAAHTNFAWYD
jgi:hypothetical protein